MAGWPADGWSSDIECVNVERPRVESSSFIDPLKDISALMNHDVPRVIEALQAARARLVFVLQPVSDRPDPAECF